LNICKKNNELGVVAVWRWWDLEVSPVNFLNRSGDLNTKYKKKVFVNKGKY